MNTHRKIVSRLLLEDVHSMLFQAFGSKLETQTQEYPVSHIFTKAGAYQEVSEYKARQIFETINT